MRELVEVWDRLEENRGRGGYGGNFSRANELKDGKQWVSIVSDWDDLYFMLEAAIIVYGNKSCTSATPFATKLGAFVSANDCRSFENSESTANEGWTDTTTSLAM